jgi:hypothetical protein
MNADNVLRETPAGRRAKKRYRAHRDAGIVCYRLHLLRDAVINALIDRGKIDEKQALDKEKVARVLEEIIYQFVRGHM